MTASHQRRIKHPRHIMIVDDHPMLVWSMDILLRQILPDCTITTVSSAHMMRDYLSANQTIDCVFLDLNLPDAIGDEAVKQCKKSAPLVPVVVYSGSAEPKIRKACLRAGAVAFLYKGTGQQDLAGQISDLLKGGGLRVNTTDDSAASGTAGFSEREVEVASCIVSGLPNKVIAEHLGVQVGTVKVHVSSLLRKLNATNRTEAAILLKDLDLIK